MSAAVAAAAAAATVSSNSSNSQRRSNQAVNHRWMPFYSQQSTQPVFSRYESQKRRDWNAFRQFLNEHRPYSSLSRCSGVDVLEFLDDQFGDTKIHTQNCPFSEISDPPSSCSCSCPIKQAWSSLDGLIGRLRVAFEENGGRPDMNPFSARVVRLYLSQLRDAQAQAKGIA